MSNVTEEYDAMPFYGDAVPHAHPAFLETVARLRGMQPAPAVRARVLELGCGVGTNLLPMAERYPEAQFLGVDLSGRQVEMAQAVARDCSLANVEFRQADVLQLGDELGEFDYVFTHGVYSWVDEAVRDKLLALSRQCLAEQGVAYVGYKTYPAWHQFEMIRAMMHYSSQSAHARAEKIAGARSALSALQGLLSPQGPRHEALLAEVARVTALPDGYLWHEYLEAVNHPVYFHQFLTHAVAQGLQFVGDGAVGVRWFDDLGTQMEAPLAAAFPDPIQREQYRDVVRNRSFRQTLLCRSDLALSPRTLPAMLQGLYVEAAFAPVNAQLDPCATTNEDFVHRAGGRVGTADRLLKAALCELGQAWPGFLRYEELIAAACRRLSDAGCPPTPAEIEQLEVTVVDCCERLVMQLHSHAPLFVTRPSESPVVSELARVQARQGATVANRRHEPVAINPLDRWLLLQLDGQVTQAQLIEKATSECAAGKLLVAKHGVPVRSQEEARRFFDAEVPAALLRMAEAALLVS